MKRRTFLAGSAFASNLKSYSAAGGRANVDQALRSGIGRREIPAEVGMFSDHKGMLYAGAFGTRDSAGPAPGLDAIFNIASMTKAITSVAAMQLVEQGKLDLSEPVSRHLPQLAGLDVLEGFDPSGAPQLRPVRTPVTLRHLLAHTGGFCYDLWDEKMFRYSSAKLANSPGEPGPLMFDPGTRWQYGQGVDWAGRLVEAISGATLEEYFQQKILGPLGMSDTSYILPETKFDRRVSTYRRGPDGKLQENQRKLPARPKTFNGGGGLYSTAGDYVRFMQMILNEGRGVNGARILKPASVEAMMSNQIGELTAGKMKSFRPEVSADVDIQPGKAQKWGLGFLINTAPYEGGRSAGTLAWAGLYNTFFWIDPKRGRCGVLMMQFLPFVDKEAVGLLDEFERAVYKEL
jgi:CubicO group peptidase (beta-lactamase class C family)